MQHHYYSLIQTGSATKSQLNWKCISHEAQAWRQLRIILSHLHVFISVTSSQCGSWWNDHKPFTWRQTVWNMTLIKSYKGLVYWQYCSCDCSKWMWELFIVSDCYVNCGKFVRKQQHCRASSGAAWWVSFHWDWTEAQAVSQQPRLLYRGSGGDYEDATISSNRNEDQRVKLTSQQGTRERCKSVCVHSVCVCLL